MPIFTQCAYLKETTKLLLSLNKKTLQFLNLLFLRVEIKIPVPLKTITRESPYVCIVYRTKEKRKETSRYTKEQRSHFYKRTKELAGKILIQCWKSKQYQLVLPLLFVVLMTGSVFVCMERTQKRTSCRRFPFLRWQHCCFFLLLIGLSGVVTFSVVLTYELVLYS